MWSEISGGGQERGIAADGDRNVENIWHHIINLVSKSSTSRTRRARNFKVRFHPHRE